MKNLQKPLETIYFLQKDRVVQETKMLVKGQLQTRNLKFKKWLLHVALAWPSQSCVWLNV